MVETVIYREGENAAELFRVLICDDGSYMAVRDHNPLFCLHAASIAEAAQVAVRTLDAWKALSPAQGPR